MGGQGRPSSLQRLGELLHYTPSLAVQFLGTSEVEHRSIGPFFAAADGPLARAAPVPYGAEAECCQAYMDALTLGPGNIEQAHTVGEWIAVEQLREAVEGYTRLVGDLCF